MLHRENTPFDSPIPLIETLRDSLDEIHKIKSRLTDLQEQLSDILLQVQANHSQSFTAAGSEISGLLAVQSATEASFGCQPSTPSSTTLDGESGNPCQLPTHESFDAAETQGADLNHHVADSVDLQKWLLDRGISIRQFGIESPFDQSFDRIALRLGRDFEYLDEFYQALKRRIGNNGGSKSIVLKNYTADRINRVVQFGEDLLRNGFLKEFRYIRNSRTILFAPQTDGRVANFITGNWLERYVVITVTQHLRKLYPGRSVEVLTNPRVTLPDGNDFELDVLVACDSIVLWFECKTGKDYPAFLAKYGVVAKKLMQLGSHRAAMILLEELNDSEKSNNSHMAGMSVLNLKDVQRFLDSIQQAANACPVAVGVPSRIAPPAAVPAGIPAPTALRVPTLKMNFTEWLAVLNREQLRPLDALVRRQIIEDCFAVDVNSPEQLPLRDVVNMLAGQYRTQGGAASKAMINDISRALYRSGCCRLAGHSDYPNPIWFLRSDIDWADAFNSTALLYVWAGIKAREPFQPGTMEAIELGRVIWGSQLSDDEVNSFIERSIAEMSATGRCTVEQLDDQVIVTAKGERFWEETKIEGRQTAPHEPPSIE